jgi:hypothetical protein
MRYDDFEVKIYLVYFCVIKIDDGEKKKMNNE